MNYLLFIVGVALVLFGAEWLVEGSSAVAKRLGVSEFLIGAIIVGIGTSMPELVVSIMAAIKGNADMTIGNITGSNLCNTLLILGATALVSPILYTKENVRRDIPSNIIVSALLLLLAADSLILRSAENRFDRIDGAIFLGLFVFYIWNSIARERKNPELAEVGEEVVAEDNHSPVWKLVAMIVVGLAGLVFGGQLFVDSASEIARSLGVSEAFIALTLMAAGTSLPELVACIVAASKGKNQLALGNIIGSNISNILLIIGSSSLITTLKVSDVSMVSIIAVPVVSLILMITPFVLGKNKLSRVEGILFIAIYVIYIWRIAVI